MNETTLSPPWCWLEGMYSDDELDEIINLGKTGKQEQGKTSIIGDNSESRKSTICWIPNNEKTSWLYDKLVNCFKYINENYYHFDLTETEVCQYSDYKIGDHYSSWHTDSLFWTEERPTIDTLPRKLSMVMQLSGPEDYEGGNFITLFKPKSLVMEKNRGKMFFFPSWLIHKITPVTRGSRKSLVCWCGGPLFK